MMRRLLLATAFLIPLAFAFPHAFADDAGAPDAGSATTAPSGSAATPATVPSLPDPSAHPVEAATTAWQMVKQYGYVWGGMIVLFALGTLVVKTAGDKHWLSQDHALPICVGLLGMLGAALEAKFAGGSWATVPATAMGVVLLIIQKPKPKPQTA